ncbi:MAG: glycosyltransferase [Bacilli bacterium]
MDINKINYLTKKSIETCKNEGLSSLARKSKNYVYLRMKKLKFASTKDILFINGCMLPHPKRYRVDHQMEQLNSSGYTTNCVDYDKLTTEMIKYYRGFIFFRCPVTDTVKEFIKIAKERNKTVFFDVDDLVIDTKYTNNIKYLKSISKEEKNLYDDGVNRMKETLELCDYAITTTERLATELGNYTKEVYINRNVVSEKMVELSLKALEKIEKDNEKIIIGYLSGSITHNDDFAMILPTITKIMKKYNNVFLKIVGHLDIPEELKDFQDRILCAPFVSWEKLPEIVASLDINLAPLENSIFNEAKSENKWIEAALCKVVTVASDIGAFKHVIRNNENGILCSSEKEWENQLINLIENKEYRSELANTAHLEVFKKYITTYTGLGLRNFIENRLNKNIAFVLPSTNISGGVNVVIKHCFILRKAGYDVSIINMDNSNDDIIVKDGIIGVINQSKIDVLGHYNTMVATLWTTLDFVKKYPNVINKNYLVQSFETNLAPYGQSMKFAANSTYCSLVPIKYLTISKWCQNWLRDDFNVNSSYAPNGINLDQFTYAKRKFDGKIKILVEGNCNDYYKNVDETFKIVEKLDKDKFEIHYLSYQGKPKDWYHIDRFMNKIPYDEVGKVYQNCDILLKTSILESFSYPPLEMMATGGISIVVPNCGNVEYLKDGENCLFYEQGNIDEAVEKIKMICKDKKLREKLILKGQETAKLRSWEKIEKDIINLYN